MVSELVAADPKAASRRRYWPPRVARLLGDFRFDGAHLDLATELINLVLDCRVSG